MFHQFHQVHQNLLEKILFHIYEKKQLILSTNNKMPLEDLHKKKKNTINRKKKANTTVNKYSYILINIIINIYIRSNNQKNKVFYCNIIFKMYVTLTYLFLMIIKVN